MTHLTIAAALTAAVTALAASTTPLAAQTFPPQHWATISGLVEVHPNGQPWENTDPVDLMRIHEAFARWSLFYDEGRADLLPSLFTGEAEMIVTLGSAEPIASFTGPQAMGDYVMSTLADQKDQRRHAMSNVLIDEITDNTAKALAYGTVIQAADGLSVGALVFYSGDLEKGDDGIWRFSRFVIGIDDYAGNLN